MNWLDGSILLIVALGAVFGALSGAFWQVVRVVMAVVGALAALRWGSWAADIFANRFGDGVSAVFGYFSVFLMACMAVWTVSFVIDQGIRASELKWLDRSLGAALGGAKALAAVLVALAGLSMYPTPEFTADVRGSLLAPALLRGAGAAMPPEARTRIQALLDEAQRRLRPLYSDRPAPEAARAALTPSSGDGR